MHAVYSTSPAAELFVSSCFSHLNRIFLICLLLIFFFLPLPVFGDIITSDTTWSGEVSVAKDVFVPEGITLTIAPGSIVRILPSDSTKTDPEFLSPMTEIIVRGTLKAEGRKGQPVTFLSEGGKKASWAGIIIDGGRAVLSSSIIRGAEAGVEVMKGSVAVRDSLISGNRYGIAAQGSSASVLLESSQVTKNDYGVMIFNKAKFESRDSSITGNHKKDNYRASAKDIAPMPKEYKTAQKETSRIYGDEALLGTIIWQKRIEVRGIIRVPERSRLIILPGTVIEFKKKDTNRDGIGENGLLIQGRIIAKGTSDNPIIFRSAEKNRQMGDWDSINIMNSDTAQNLIEHCQIEDAYRGLHFHFSNVAVNQSVLRNNFRGIQFQESIVEIRGTDFYRNKSGLQARDSEILFSGNVLYQNYIGMNVLRNTISITGNSFVSNSLEGLRVREGVPVLEENLIAGNRQGLLVSDGVYGTYSRNVISHNTETGLALKDTENIEISGNVLQENGINGMNILDSSAVIRRNLISDNGERGIGILSFQGVITGNNILRNRLYNLGIDGAADVSVQENWWGGDDLQKTIYDKADDPEKGRADYLPVLGEPVLFAWPLQNIKTDSNWHGNILIKNKVSVANGTKLAVSSGTKVYFDKGAGMNVKGMILAKGEENARIAFTAHNSRERGYWDEIHLDHAEGSSFANCIFEYATWGLHVHFTNLRVEGCSFVNNYGGMRFSSGPLEIRNSLFSENVIGLRSYRGKALVTGSIIRGNETGIFVREKGGGLSIKKNNFSENSGYHIRLGDFNDEDVDARDNWWGGVSPAEKIYDAAEEPEIGRVIFEPFAREPFHLGPLSKGSMTGEPGINSRQYGVSGK